jgi:hypothetical protein
MRFDVLGGRPSFIIGHGHSLVWHELKDFLENRLGLSVDEFNRVPVAGIATSTRLTEMLDAAAFAFLVMTAEDEQTDGKVRARENVVHGRAFPRKAWIQSGDSSLEGGLRRVLQHPWPGANPIPEG